ncbi:substrate-binding domain-containing protein [Lactonifactor longoviformis]|uniref:Ribose transport system substrate-binding protein n=1 Tax=Lactonifactor longoviformis DSM 17459 TaxID=1122155 RepID=A0A1M5CLE4_9CLOT|nr:substrate-binding domain-containing protein [Lactonifactor longoviformis]SHF55533.1 ribose transport system substrate-binding protein [Lactonifactor longoviformis DSM 17459]
MKRQKVMKWLALAMAGAMTLGGCGEAKAKNSSSEGAETKTEDVSDEVYVWACQHNSLPLFVNNDYIGMDLIAEQLGVTVKKIGPQEIDLPAFVAAIEQEIPQKPDGMMVVGWDASLATAIDKAMEAGIPTITVDADVPDSQRLCFVGSNWYDQGVEQAKAIAPYLEGKKGKAVMIGLPGANNTVEAANGYTETLAKLAPDIEVVTQVYDAQSNAQVVAETVGNLLKSDSSILAVAGFESACGPGISQAIKEADMVGKVYGTCVDAEAEHIQCIKDGTIVAACGQKRHFFTYYGVRMLYDYKHNNIDFTGHDAEIGISPIPTEVSTGFIVVTPDNVKYFDQE